MDNLIGNNDGGYSEDLGRRLDLGEETKKECLEVI